MSTLIALLVAPAAAGTLAVALGDRAGALLIPASLEVGLSLSTAKGASAAWTNNESNALSMHCGAGKAPQDEFVEQLMLEVGDEKWALAPGSSIQLSCAAGATLTITDLHGTEVGAFTEPVRISVAKAKPRAAR